jgi:hypothetical protein
MTTNIPPSRAERVRADQRTADRHSPQLRLVPMGVPDPAALGLSWPELTDWANRSAAIYRERDEHAAGLEALRAALGEVVDADRQALADAIRAGKPEPTEKAADKLREKIAKAERRRDALDLAARAVNEELLAIFGDRMDSWRDDVEARTAQARERVAEQVAALRGSIQLLVSLRSARRWLQSFPRPHRGAGGDLQVRVPGMANREPVSAGAVLTALEQLARAPGEPS